MGGAESYIRGMARTYLMLLSGLLAVSVLGQRATAQVGKPPAAQQGQTIPAKTVHELYLADQAVDPTKTTQEEYNKTAEASRTLVRGMLEKGTLLSAEDFHDAAFLFQHGEDPRDYLLAHVLAVEAVMRGDAASKWLVAATLDRYLQMIKQPQVFGTQYPLGTSAGAQAEHRRNTYQGRTQEPFDTQTISASIRKDFCVPDLKQQKGNLALLNSGTYPDESMVAPGCTR